MLQTIRQFEEELFFMSPTLNFVPFFVRLYHQHLPK